MTHIVGMMFSHNEGDILEETMSSALNQVDSLFFADDGSTDNSWDVIEPYKSLCEVAVKRDRTPKDKGQRQFLLDEIRKRYKPEDTWVQIIESDIFILDTDIKEAIKKHAVHDLAMSWMCLNAARPKGGWTGEIDSYPNWEIPMRTLMPGMHWMEFMLYTFRPLPGLIYDSQNAWRPWPSGFGQYADGKQVKGAYGRKPDAPLLLHVGYRGPRHFCQKYKGRWPGDKHPKYGWDVSSVDKVRETCFFFNGTWNKRLMEASRAGWVRYRTS